MTKNRTRTIPLAVLGLAAMLVLSPACYDADDADRVGENETETTQPPGTDVAPAPETPPATETTGRSLGTRIDDQTLQIQVKAKLTADGRVEANDINLQVLDGKVIMTGTVPTEAARAAAEEDAKAVEGITSVDNQLIVRAR